MHWAILLPSCLLAVLGPIRALRGPLLEEQPPPLLLERKRCALGSRFDFRLEPHSLTISPRRRSVLTGGFYLPKLLPPQALLPSEQPGRSCLCTHGGGLKHSDVQWMLERSFRSTPWRSSLSGRDTLRPEDAWIGQFHEQSCPHAWCFFHMRHTGGTRAPPWSRAARRRGAEAASWPVRAAWVLRRLGAGQGGMLGRAAAP